MKANAGGEPAVFVLTVTNEEYALIGGNLMRARQFLTALRATSDARDQKVIREALTLAAIVSYCRPFKTSRDAEGQKRPWIPPELIKDLPEQCQRTHNRCVRARNQAWAHTDWAAHTPRSCEERGEFPSVLSRNPWVPMSPPEIDEFESLLREVDVRVHLRWLDAFGRDHPTHRRALRQLMTDAPRLSQIGHPVAAASRPISKLRPARCFSHVSRSQLLSARRPRRPLSTSPPPHHPSAAERRQPHCLFPPAHLG